MNESPRNAVISRALPLGAFCIVVGILVSLSAIMGMGFGNHPFGIQNFLFLVGGPLLVLIGGVIIAMNLIARGRSLSNIIIGLICVEAGILGWLAIGPFICLLEPGLILIGLFIIIMSIVQLKNV